MDAKTRRQLPILLVLLAALAAALWWNLPSASDPVQGTRTRAPRAAARTTISRTAVDRVRLDALASPRPAPTIGGRDPFRFRPVEPATRQAPPGESTSASSPTGSGEDAPPVVTGPPPIPVRFIGVMRLPGDGRLIAVLSDGNGVYRGSEGDIIEGRYRIVRLRPEAVELAHVDGRGHQVIRLSGS